MKYASLKQNTWMYRRHYPVDVKRILGRAALKQSLKTGDIKVTKERVTELNLRFDDTVRRVRAGLDLVDQQPDWAKSMTSTLKALDWAPVAFQDLRKSPPVGPLAKEYLRLKARKLQPGGYKAVRYSVGLFASRHQDTLIGALDRDDGKAFLRDIALLSASLGKSHRYHGKSLEQLLRASEGMKDKITVQTQKRIWTQVSGFVDWAMYEGHLTANPFKTVRFDEPSQRRPYLVPSDDEVRVLLRQCLDKRLWALLMLCLLTGMRLGEALGLQRSDVSSKGNLGLFVKIKPNDLRGLKTAAAERVVPLHSALQPVLDRLPSEGPLFPGLSVNMMTKAFAKLREQVDLGHLVFHGTRKWFITSCERTGVPEHFTASLVGHKSARSGNGITYAIYSGGISDAQKRGIIDQLRLPL